MYLISWNCRWVLVWQLLKEEWAEQCAIRNYVLTVGRIAIFIKMFAFVLEFRFGNVSNDKDGYSRASST